MSGSSRLWIITGLALVVSAVCWPSVQVLAQQWSDFVNLTYTHGWLILAVCIALVVRERVALAAASAHPSRAALIVLALAMFCWLVAWRASIQDLHVTILPALFWLAVAGAFGAAVGRLLLFPVLFFYFAVPSWSQLAVPLQELTVLAMRLLLALTGPAALFSGDLIHIPTGTFVVEEGCSGLHFMIVGLAVAALHGELERDPWRIRLAQLALMAGLALIANWVRVFVIIEVGYFTDMHSGLLPNHYWFGWGVFAVALFVFFWLVGRLPAQPARTPQAARGAAGSLRADLTGAALAAVVLAAVPAASAAARLLHPGAAPAAQMSARVRAPWQPTLVDVHSSWQPVFRQPDRQQHLAFTNSDGATLELFEVRYRTQVQGAKLVAGVNTLLGSELLGGPEATVATASGDFHEREVAERAPPHYVYLLWSRYESAGRGFARAFPSQLWYGVSATVSNPSASLLALRTACRPDCVAARRVLQDFVAGMALPYAGATDIP